MKLDSTRAASAVFALVLAGLAGHAHASCVSSERIDFRNADCLSAEWDNKNLSSSPNIVKTQNRCSDIGDVVARVDVDGKIPGDFGDFTVVLTDGRLRTTNTPYKVKGVYCCENFSDLCNKSDIADSCLERFMRSPGSHWCRNVSAGFDSDGWCAITAECANGSGGYPSTSVTVKLADADDLRNCSGSLGLGDCSTTELVPPR